MTLSRAFVGVVFAVCLGGSTAAGQRDAELDRLVLFATTHSARISAAFDSIVEAARRDSGTARADSTVLRFRRTSMRGLRTLDSVFANGPFEREINSGGPRSDSLRALLNSRGVWASSSEGTMYYNVSVPLLLERLAACVTPPVRAYLEMEAIEQRRPSAEDGSFMVPREEIIDRIARTERFLEAYPQVSLTKWVAYNRDRYMTWMLYPALNFATFDETGALSAEARRAMERLATERSSHASGKAAREMLDVLKANGYHRTPAVESFVLGKWKTLHDETAASIRLP